MREVWDTDPFIGVGIALAVSALFFAAAWRLYWIANDEFDDPRPTAVCMGIGGLVVLGLLAGPITPPLDSDYWKWKPVEGVVVKMHGQALQIKGVTEWLTCEASACKWLEKGDLVQMSCKRVDVKFPGPNGWKCKDMRFKRGK